MRKNKAEVYSVHIERDPTTGQIIEERWTVEDTLHHPDRPALCRYHPHTGERTEEAWFKHGKLHRDGEYPAYSATRYNGVTDTTVMIAEFYVDGEAHRLGGPCFTETDLKSGIVLEEEWMRNGNRHRDQDRPAHIHRDRLSGFIVYAGYYCDGRCHRDNAPAELWYHSKSGAVQSMRYSVHGEEVKMLDENSVSPPFTP